MQDNHTRITEEFIERVREHLSLPLKYQVQVQWKEHIMMLTDLLESEQPERIATGFEFTEGPVWNQGGYLLFSDIPADRIYKWSLEGGVEVFREPSGNSNGLTFDREGRLIACEHGNRQMSRTEPDGSITSLATHYQGQRLNSPNDVVVKSDGSIYFTDPPYGVEPEERELDFQGVYRIAPDGALTLLADDLDRPNGLAFSSDESILYVDDTTRRRVWAFDVLSDGALANGRVFAEMESSAPGGPDGMKLDSEGNLYVAGPGGTWILDPDGNHLGTFVTPEQPSNLAFGDADRRTLYITARTSLYLVQTKLAGI
ncbi:MAG: SMP-30/gluconolactonase/LRE family protein [Chloroflexota bacterium]|nr:SMP-30/gluconolactonase/LRE family protein [Chloroflexota bacterium]